MAAPTPVFPPRPAPFDTAPVAAGFSADTVGPEALQRALMRSEERFRHLVKRAGCAIYRSTPRGQFLDVNPALVRMLGYACEEEVLALDLARDVYVDANERELLRRRLEHGGEVDGVQTRWKRKDGTPITVRLCVWAVRDERGRPECYEGIAENVTEQVRSDALLRRSERMACLGATLAGVAHELNNPLAAVLGFAQLILRKPLDEESRAALETISHEAARAGKIVRDLLTLARKREALRHGAVDLNEVVTYIVQTRRYALETHGITCVTELEPLLPHVSGDRTQLEQVVLNLLNNAEHAVRSARPDGCGGRVAVRTRCEGPFVLLDVEDDGPGIPPHVRERIWDPFWTTKEVGMGTGLGLAVVHGIIASHGGVIRVDDAGDYAVGGARFTIHLPGLTSDPCGDGRASPGASRALDILVIAEDVGDASFLTHFLSSRGHAAIAATDIGDALRFGEGMRFDAVVCEASMAGSSEMLHALRSLDGLRAARFVIAAGGPDTTARLPLPLPARTSVVMQPYDLEELRVLLED